jgi:predicted anti-sigma-YlaC factor YlaD
MRCRDLEELLSAYADGELNKTQKEFIEEHLECCPDCRATFSEFSKAGRLLSTLELMPRSIDIRENIISKIKAVEVSSGSSFRRCLRPILTIGTVLLVLAVFYLAYRDSGRPAQPQPLRATALKCSVAMMTDQK